VPLSLPEGESTVFQLQISLVSVTTDELSDLAVAGEEFWVSYMVLNVEVKSERFAEPRQFKSLTDEFSLRGPLSHIRRYIQDSPALLHLYGSRSGLLGTAVLALDSSDGLPVQSRVEFGGGRLRRSSLVATVALMEGDNESVVSSATSSRVSSHAAVEVPQPASSAAAATQHASAAEARELVEACLKLQEDLQTKLAAVEAHEAALERREQDWRRKSAEAREELSIRQRRLEEEMEHKLVLERLKQEAVVKQLRAAEQDALAQRSRVKRLEEEVRKVRDAFADTSLGRLEAEIMRLRGEVDDYKDRLARERREHAYATELKDKQVLVLAAELESLRLQRQGPLAKSLATAVVPQRVAPAPARLQQPAPRRRGAAALHEPKRSVAKVSSAAKPTDAAAIVRSVVARGRELRNHAESPELQALLADEQKLVNSGQYAPDSFVLRQIADRIAEARAKQR